jgi:manganese-dependent ADP-ribose/CDP-alcohol diphosphatase
MTSQNDNDLLFSFGLITDIQYADIDNQSSGWGKERYYRDSIKKISPAIVDWNNHNVLFSLNLGDLIDARCGSRANSLVHIDEVLSCFNTFTKPIFHLFGNHDIYHVERETVIKKYNIENMTKQEDVAYYDFCLHEGWRFIVLDTYEISVYGRSKEHPNYARAVQILKDSELIPVHERGLYYQRYNGAVSDTQLNWLRERLDYASKNNERVIIASHAPLHPKGKSTTNQS